MKSELCSFYIFANCSLNASIEYDIESTLYLENDSKRSKILIRHQFSYDIILKNESKLYAQYRLIRIINKYVVVFIKVFLSYFMKTIFKFTVFSFRFSWFFENLPYRSPHPIITPGLFVQFQSSRMVEVFKVSGPERLIPLIIKRYEANNQFKRFECQ